MTRLLLAALLATGVAASPAAAQLPDDSRAERGDPRLERIRTLAGELRSEDAAVRAAAVEALSHLSAEALPAIRARLRRLSWRRPSVRWARDIYRQIRRAAGSRRADDDVDIAGGVLPVLAESRHRRVRRMVEPLLLWRSLEALGTFEACLAMRPIVAMDEGVWFQEARRVAARLGPRIVAAAIVSRRDDRRLVRRWAQRTMRRHHADEPGRAIQGLDEALLPDVLTAYAVLRMQSAMPLMASFLGSPRRRVRRAARWAIEQYGGNAIWVLRTAYRTQTGDAPPAEWGWRRVYRELLSLHEAERLAPVREALDAARAARAREDWDAVAHHYGDALARATELDDATEAASDLAALGAARAAAGDRRAARSAYGRALRLAPEHPEAARWAARRRYLEAEARHAAGVFDAGAYAEVLGADPTHEGARARLAALAPERAPALPGAPPARTPPTWPAGILAALGVALLLAPRRRRSAAEPSEPPDRTLPEEPEDTLVDGPATWDSDATLVS